MLEQSRMNQVYGAAILATLLGGAIGLWPGLLQNLMVVAGFVPHGHCYLWKTPLVSLHATSDILIGLSYVSISATLVYLIHRAQRDIPFHWMFLAFGLFIVACGTTHFMEVWTLWVPIYWLSGAIKLLTAIVSVTTALLLPPLIPQVLNLVQAAKISEERRLQLEQANQELRELNERLKEQMALAIENARLYQEAQEVSQMKDDFLAVVSHELRTPLNAMLGWSQTLQTRQFSEETRRRALETIERNARLQAQLIDDILDFSRIIRGKMRLHLQSVQLIQILEAALASVRPTAEAKQISLSTVITATDPQILGDPDRLQQILWNLLSNAVKFTPETGKVSVYLEEADSRVQIRVVDTGIGISPEFLPHVFDHFRQADSSTTRSHGGLGLGLAIVRQLVELQGGTVYAESIGEGLGATFTIVFPLLTPDLLTVEASLIQSDVSSLSG